MRERSLSVEQNDDDQLVIPWEDLATLALEEWTPRMTNAALANHPDILPGLNRHQLVEVSLPVYLVRLLHHLAEHESRTHTVPRNASDIIETLLHHHADTLDTATIEDAIPGFTQAHHYPTYHERYGAHYHRCRYCGIPITTLSLAICNDCEHRHHPQEHLREYGLPTLDDDIA